MREVAAYLLFNKEKRVLLMHRTLDAPTNPDFWGFFGGGVKNSETPLEAVKREAIEELGIDLENIKLFKMYKPRDNRGLQIRDIFIGNPKHLLEELKNKPIKKFTAPIIFGVVMTDKRLIGWKNATANYTVMK